MRNKYHMLQIIDFDGAIGILDQRVLVPAFALVLPDRTGRRLNMEFRSSKRTLDAMFPRCDSFLLMGVIQSGIENKSRFANLQVIKSCLFCITFVLTTATDGILVNLENIESQQLDVTRSTSIWPGVPPWTPNPLTEQASLDEVRVARFPFGFPTKSGEP